MRMWFEGLMRGRVLHAPEGGASGGAAGGTEGGGAAGADGAAGGAASGGSLLGGAGGAAGGGSGDARAWLPEEYRADPAFKDLADVGALAKSYRHSISLVGADRAQLLQMPKEGAPDDKWEGWGRLGRPENPDGYKIDTPPAGVPEEGLKTFRARMFAAGASQKQVSEALAVYSEIAGVQQAAADKAGLTVDRQKALFGAVVGLDAAQAQMKQSWGAAYGDKLAAAKRGVLETGGDKLMQLFEATGLGNNPVILDAFAKVGERLAEPGSLKGGGSGAMGGALTPDAAKAEIARLSADKEFFKTMGDAASPGHAEAMRKWNELHTYAFGAAA